MKTTHGESAPDFREGRHVFATVLTLSVNQGLRSLLRMVWVNQESTTGSVAVLKMPKKDPNMVQFGSYKFRNKTAHG